MKTSFKVLLVAMALVALGPKAWAQDSVEERLQRLEQLVEKQQQQLSDRDSQIARMEASQQMSSKINSMPSLADAPKVETPNDMTVQWKNGLVFSTKDKSTTIKLGGRIMWQMGFISEDTDYQNQLGQTEPDFVQLRRSRIYMSGTMYKHIIFKAQYDFANNGVSEIDDMYMGIKDIPIIGQWRVGHMKEVFDKEDLESSKYIQFIERSFQNQAFTPERNFGMDFHNYHLDGRIQWAAGVYRATDDSVAIRQDFNYIGAARVSGLPYWANEGKRHLHVGIAGRYAETSGADHTETVLVQARPSVRTVNRPISTGPMGTYWPGKWAGGVPPGFVGPISASANGAGDNVFNDDYRLSAELAFNWDSFNIDAQFIGMWLTADDDRWVRKYTNGLAPGRGAVALGANGMGAAGVAHSDELVSADDVFLWGAKVDVSYWLTGESRKYDKKSGTYGRVSPEHNFALDGSGFGAVQLVARFHYLDLNSDEMDDIGWHGDDYNSGDQVALAAGAPATMWGVMAGVNWHLNPNTRIMANYNYWQVEKDYFDTAAPTFPAPVVPVVNGVHRYFHDDITFNAHALTFMFQVDW